ncbi:MAG: flavodoxin family protein [Jatrophihabitantaceae bacterium]
MRMSAFVKANLWREEKTMRSLIVYESMYGNTRQIAEAIADGCRRAGEATTVRAAECEPAELADLGLLVVGGPTHAWSMSRPKTRDAAVTDAARGAPRLEAKPGEPGVRELLARLPRLDCPAAAYDTRIGGMPAMVTGHASAGIARRLRGLGTELLGRQSFLVTRDNRLQPGELERARAWGVELTEQRAGIASRRSH